jgi:uncharacterized flavoprotein (TIGR03862 family)
MTRTTPHSIGIIGGGPAGLMAAEVARVAGLEVDLYESQGSVGRKFLLAGKGGLNLTHSESFEPFVARYGARAEQIARWLTGFDNNAVRDWARGLGVETMIGTSGRIFPADLKAAPLLRGWVRRLRASGVRIHVHHAWCGFEANGSLRFNTPPGERRAHHDATILALGGGSWPQLGSDGAWVSTLQRHAVDVAPLLASNCGFDIAWSHVFANRYAGQPVKAVVTTARDAAGAMHSVHSEFVITAYGVEGGAIYALAPALRDVIARDGATELRLDLAPAREQVALEVALSRPRGSRSLTGHLRRTAGIDGVKAGLLYEVMSRPDMQAPARLAATIKSLPLQLLRPRPIAEAISTAGGVRFEAMNEGLMIACLPGVFCAGEMIDWEAPTGGYLLTACLASGRVAATGVVKWLRACQP